METISEELRVDRLMMALSRENSSKHIMSIHHNIAQIKSQRLCGRYYMQLFRTMKQNRDSCDTQE